MIFVIDNYDSFTYNLVQLLGSLGEEVRVFRNDRIDPGGISDLDPTALIISPGPGTPAKAGVSVHAVRELYDKLPILGVCLGHQSIGVAFGGRIGPSPALMHGKTSKINHNGEGIYQGMENPFVATRYHSLLVEEDSISAPLLIEARSEDGEVMGVRHKEYPVFGVQFHPESILTAAGRQLVKNFLAIAQAAQKK